jgi:thiol:disulfide interchange protein DsbD
MKNSHNYFLYSLSPLLLLGLFFLTTNTTAADNTLNQALNKLIKEPKQIQSPDEAFKLSATLNNLNQIELSWDIGKNCFLYKEKIKITPELGQTLYTDFKSVTQEDEYFGLVNVFYDQLVYKLTFKSNKMLLTYQGCNETGFCYPPISKQLIVNTLTKSITII